MVVHNYMMTLYLSVIKLNDLFTYNDTKKAPVFINNDAYFGALEKHHTHTHTHTHIYIYIYIYIYI